MKRQSGFSWRRATGIYYARQRLTIASARVGALGTRDVVVQEEDVPQDGLTATLGALRAEGVIAGPVLCALDPRLVFSVTRRLTDDDRGRGAAELLKEHVGPVDGGIASGLLPLKLSGGGFHAVYACERETATALLEGLGPMRESQRRCVPVVQALLPLLRAASAPRRAWRTWIALVPGAHFGLAVLVHGNQVVATRLFASRDQVLDQAAGEAALHGLRTHARDELQLARLDAVIVHGAEPADAGSAAQALGARMADELDVSVHAAPNGFSLDDQTLAACLARQALAGAPQPLDLFTELTSVRTAWDHVPARPLAGVAAAALIAAGVLWWQAADMEGLASSVRARAKVMADRAGVQLKQLPDRNKALKKEVELAQAFAVDRVYWEDYLRELPRLMPPTMFLTRLDGRNGLRWSERSSAETKLTITAEVPVERLDYAPPEVSEFTQAINTSELFQAELPKMRSSSLRFQQGVASSVAKQTILCTPR